VPSSAPEILKTMVAIRTLASSGVNVKVMSVFYLGPMVPVQIFKINKINVDKAHEKMEFLFQNKTVMIITCECRNCEGAVLGHYLKLHEASKIWIGKDEGASSGLVDAAIPKVDAGRR
jgi:hypothetical protein